MTNRRLATTLALALVVLELAFATGCATTSKSASRKANKVEEKVVRKGGRDKNFTLHNPRDVEWKWIRRGRKAMGGAALDSY